MAEADSRDGSPRHLGRSAWGGLSARGFSSDETAHRMEYKIGHGLGTLYEWVLAIGKVSVVNALRILGMLAYKIALEPVRELWHVGKAIYSLIFPSSHDTEGSSVVADALWDTVICFSVRIALISLVLLSPVVPAVMAAVSGVAWLPVMMKTVPVVTVALCAMASLVGALFRSAYDTNKEGESFFVLKRACAEKAINSFPSLKNQRPNFEDAYGDGATRRNVLSVIRNFKSGSLQDFFRELKYIWDEIKHGMMFDTPLDGYLYGEKALSAPEPAGAPASSAPSATPPARLPVDGASRFMRGWHAARQPDGQEEERERECLRRKLTTSHLFSPELDPFGKSEAVFEDEVKRSQDEYDAHACAAAAD